MKLIVLTPEEDINNEPALAEALLCAGLQRLHLRKRNYTEQQTLSYINAISPAYHNRIVLHHHFGLLTKLQLGGIHLNSMVRTAAGTWPLISHIPHAAMSTSFHSWQEISENRINYGYVFISPVFDSISKPGYMGSIDLAVCSNVQEEKKKTGAYCPGIIALGGINGSNIALLRKYPFQGAALLGHIWTAPDPVAAFTQLLSEV
jgi:thiamine-phosphate pyrophosphorylase